MYQRADVTEPSKLPEHPFHEQVDADIRLHHTNHARIGLPQPTDQGGYTMSVFEPGEKTADQYLIPADAQFKEPKGPDWRPSPNHLVLKVRPSMTLIFQGEIDVTHCRALAVLTFMGSKSGRLMDDTSCGLQAKMAKMMRTG
jgi:hypothetical protein